MHRYHKLMSQHRLTAIQQAHPVWNPAHGVMGSGQGVASYRICSRRGYFGTVSNEQKRRLGNNVVATDVQYQKILM
jgi:hypothetical protein